MAASESSSSGAEQPPSKSEIKKIAIKINVKIPPRQLTLIAITLLLNILFWSSLVCLATSVYQVASDPNDTTIIAPVVLTSTSALVTISYTFLHTIFSLKQTIWIHQQRNPSAIKKTSYIAIRIVISLCVLWLLTSGWNMILVARRPMCLLETPRLQGWDMGTTCQMGRVGMAFAMIALIASGTLFGVLATVRRPFEAHLFNCGYQQPVDVYSTSSASRRPSPTPRASFTSEKVSIGRWRSASTHRSTPSNFSSTNIEIPDLNASPPPSTIHAPSPIRKIGLGIFTTDSTPPPIPTAYSAPRRASSNETLQPIFHPSMSRPSLSRPPRLSGLVTTSGFMPLSIPVQYSASAWRAVHPSSPPMMQPASRSHPHLPSAGFAYRGRYSRSSISLTRPHRLSTATPGGSVDWSSRSGSTGTEGRDSPTSGENEADQAATPSEIAYAILNGTAIPVARPISRSMDHMRTTSAPDATSGAQQPHQLSRMAIGWKPQLAGQETRDNSEAQFVPDKPGKIVQCSFTSFLSRFSPDTSPDDDVKKPHSELEKELDAKTNTTAGMPFRRSRSADPMRHSSAPPIAEAAASMASKVPEDLRIPKVRPSSAEAERKRRRTFDAVKNKPLPKIAVL